MQVCILASSSIATLALSCLFGLSSCVDSSAPSFEASTIDPSAWTFRPGKIQTFTAFDPNNPTATFLWSAPPEVKNLSQTPNQITLSAKSALGKYELKAYSSSAGTLDGLCKLEVVDYSFGFQLAMGNPGEGNHKVHADLAILPPSAPGSQGRVWVAYWNEGFERHVNLYDSDFKTQLQSTGIFFDGTHRPEIAVDAAGVGYSIEGPTGTHADQLVRFFQDKDPEEIDLVQLLASLQLSVSPNTDIAIAPTGDLVFECLDNGVKGVYRIVDPFGASPSAVWVCSTNNYHDVQLEFDAEGRLLIADNGAAPTLHRVTGEGPAASSATLASFQDTIEDVDEDYQGALYVTTPTRVFVLDTEGTQVFELKETEVLNNKGILTTVEFQALVASDIDEDGNLRVIDGLTKDTPNLGFLWSDYYYKITLQ